MGRLISPMASDMDKKLGSARAPFLPVEFRCDQEKGFP
jgi:hypothetical protein